MGFPQRYNGAETERRWQETWASNAIYQFAPADSRPIFAIDTPPPTVSGEIHIGHVYSYVQAEVMARFWRMHGYNVYYPFGFDDNGLPTERFVERARGIRARDLSREAFIATCLDVSREVEDRFEMFWKSLGMSVDWRMRYSTIDPSARRTSQWSFLDLHRKGLVYRAKTPNPWCIECQTAIAQAEMDDIERPTTFYTLNFLLENADLQPTLPIATTRPELLPACVAIFVHPDDPRFAGLAGTTAIIPLFDRQVPILADPAVDPQKGSGAVMCCTFGDSTDAHWWKTYQLPLIPLITKSGRLSAEAGPYAGMGPGEARKRIIADLEIAGLIHETRPATQTVRVHERCGTPLELLETSQWYIRILDAKAALLEAGRAITWRPAYMHTRYEHWVENLNWDWCISRQRFFGVPFPAWHCDQCGATILADEHSLPLDPTTTPPPHACACGNTDLRPDEDIMDTWATSSVSPQIAGRMLENPALYQRLFPMQLRPQAHDIIRTWAFYTIAKSHFHFGKIPWETIMISGHALDPSGRKFSKSKGNAPVMPTALIERYGADALRYWACGSALGADQPLSEDAMRQGARLVNKLWNAARLIAGHLEETPDPQPAQLYPADRAMLSWLQRLIIQASASFQTYEYAPALEATERFFWGTLCDNYLELVKSRLYDGQPAERLAARQALYPALLTILKLLAPIMPHITEEIFSRIYAPHEGASIHTAAWPQPDQSLIDPQAELAGEAILVIATAVRRYKTAHQIGLGAPLDRLTIAASDPRMHIALAESIIDLRSITRAAELTIVDQGDEAFEEVAPGLALRIETNAQ